jgi:vacuolar protein sorting-associated protein 13A/C
LSTGSSYSIAAEDGVEVSVLESSFGNDDADLLKLEEHVKRTLHNASDAPANQMLNFTFEAQVSTRSQLCKFLFLLQFMGAI